MSDSEDSDYQPVDPTLPPPIPDLVFDSIASAAINGPGSSADTSADSIPPVVDVVPPVVDIAPIDRELITIWYNQSKFLRARFDEAIRLSYRTGLQESANEHAVGLVQSGAALVGQLFETLPITHRSHSANMEALNTMEVRSREYAEDVWTSLEVADAVLDLNDTIELSDAPGSADGDLSDLLPEDSGEEEEEGGPEGDGSIESNAAAEPVCVEEPTFSSDDEFNWS